MWKRRMGQQTDWVVKPVTRASPSNVSTLGPRELRALPGSLTLSDKLNIAGCSEGVDCLLRELARKPIEDVAAPSDLEVSNLFVGERIQASLVKLIVDPFTTVGVGNCAMFKLDDVPATRGSFGNSVDWNEWGGCGDYEGRRACKEGPDCEKHFGFEYKLKGKLCVDES